MHRSIIAAVLTALLVGCNSSDSNTDTFSKTGIEPNTPVNRSCPANMQCGLLPVPKSYANDNGEKVDIFYAVHKAIDADKRIGILLLNFGGPGGEAVWGASNMVDYYLPQEILERFDIVGLDPRGTGGSAFAPELTDCAVAQNNGSGNCDSTYAQIAPYLGSNTIVKDIDQLRIFLGEDKLNFLGYSYGTRLGSLYANTFPQKVRALVLDSPMPPATGNYTDLRLGNTVGHDLVANYRLEFNAARKYQYENIISSVIYNDYYFASDGESLYPGDAQTLLSATISREHTGDWKEIKDGLFTLLDEDTASQLRTDLYYVSSSSETTNAQLRSSALFKAVVCTDESNALSASDVAARQYSFENASALYGLINFYITDMCADWPIQRDPIAMIENMEQRLAGQQILVIGGKYDPATPYHWAEEMVSSFGNLGSLITVDKLVNHGFSFNDMNCIDQKTTQYLLDPATKVESLTCANTQQVKTSFSAKSKPAHPTQKALTGTY
ncbi:alpha/beta hydrolase [Psychromonas ossibalaenae]|uniref:alpha/beta hydrolase n=1 Tax=Psychromonas ossibalaenae TaxID=444922 RepID=UPI000360E19D|nr:alpha/beta hydrolase [Psychromonas ossibalaenae]